MTFTTTKLAGNRVVVTGTDVFGGFGQTIVDSTQWEEINGHTEFNQAKEAFEAAVEDFFAPLMEAKVQLDKQLERPEDALGYVVLEEGQEATPAVERQLIKLSRDSQILRLLDQGNTDRLMWVSDELEILAEPADVPVPVTPVYRTGSTVDAETNLG